MTHRSPPHRRGRPLLATAPSALSAALLVAAGLSLLARTPAASAADAASTAAVASAVPAEAGVHVTQAWIRWLPGNLPAGGYLTLVNDRDAAVTLVAARSATYASVQLHRTLLSGGLTRMVPVAGITVPAHGTLDFASLGYHLMLMQARTAVHPGQQVPLRLQFADGGVLRVRAEVKPPTAQPGAAAAKGMPGMANMPGMTH